MAAGRSIEAAFTRPTDYFDHEEAVRSDTYLSYIEPDTEIGDVLSAVARSDTSPPLYYMLLRFWLRCFGASVLSARLLSLLFASVTIVIIHQLGCAFNRNVGIAATLLTAVSPFHVNIPSDIRMYSLLSAEAAMSLLLTLRIMKEPRQNRCWAAWSSVNLAGLYTHYLFASFFGAVVLILLLEGFRTGKVPIRTGVIFSLIPFLLFLPWTGAIKTQFTERRITEAWLYAPMPLLDLAAMCVSNTGGLLTGMRRHLPSSCAVIALYFLGLHRVWRLKERVWPRILGLCFFLPLFFVFTVDAVRSTHQTAFLRYLILASPALFLAIAIALDRLPRVLFLGSVACISMLLTARGFKMMQRGAEQWEPFNRAARYVAGRIVEQDGLVVIRSIPSGVISFCYYLDRPLPVGGMTAAEMENPEVARRLGKLIADKHTDIWLVLAHSSWSSSFQAVDRRILQWLEDHFRVVDRATVGIYGGAIKIFRFSREPPA